MSSPPEEIEDAAAGEEDLFEEVIADMADLPSAQGDGQQGGRDDHQITELLEQERRRSTEGPQEEDDELEDDTGIVNRYKQLAQNDDLDASSDNLSVDVLPKGVTSPVDSTVSIPDDTPSVQVR